MAVFETLYREVEGGNISMVNMGLAPNNGIPVTKYETDALYNMSLSFAAGLF